MNNSLDKDVYLGYLSNIHKDIRMAYPDLVGLERDYSRLTTLIETRGPTSFMRDLPNLDSILLYGLENGFLVLEGALCRAVSRVTKVPKLYSGLWLKVFDKMGVLLPVPDTTAIAFLRLIFNFFKKIEVECPEPSLQGAVKEFYNVESELRESTILWEDSEFDCFDSVHGVHFRDAMDDYLNNVVGENLPHIRSNIALLCDRLQRVADSISSALGYYDPYSFTNGVGRIGLKGRKFRHGRGAVSDMKRYSNRYHFPSWSERLNNRFPYEAFGHYDLTQVRELKECAPSKLMAVPKDIRKPRLIASEPTSNQWCQQITLQWFVERFEQTGLRKFINLKDQGASQQLVIKASRDQSLATVDLSSASDRLTCWTVERIFRKNISVLSALQAHRTPTIVDGTGVTDLHIFQKKFASQGTAVTFPVQTLVFLCCVAAALGCNSLTQLEREFAGKVRVYGDDIILPVFGYDNLCLLLDYLQLKVNKGKSFVHGKFRESCGMDAYMGDDVTPIKPKTLIVTGPRSLDSVIQLSNNLFNKGYWHTANFAQKTIPNKYLRYLPVVPPGSGVLGFASYSGALLKHLPSRWNANLQRQEYMVISTSTRVERVAQDDYTGIFQYFAEDPSPFTKWTHGVTSVPRFKVSRKWVWLPF